MEEAGGTHRNRADWFRHRFAYPVREANATNRPGEEQKHQRLVAERTEAAKRGLVKPAQAGEWRPIGPSNFAGRITSLACDLTDTKTIYAGSAGGGVWRSRNAGKKWKPLWDDRSMFPVLSVGCLAMKDQVLYAGTGEANLSSDNYPGIGEVYQFNQDQWNPMGSPLGSKEIPPPGSKEIPSRIGTIAVDPANPYHLRIGGVRHFDEYPSGMFSFDGEVWAREPRLLDGVDYYCHSIVYHPDKNKNWIFAAIDARGSQSGIWRKKGNGDWEQLKDRGLPAGDQFARTSLAITGDRIAPTVIYALAADRAGGVLGVFRSDDEGDTWDEIGNGKFRYERQMSYNNCIAVHPEDPDFVIWGGIDLHRTKDGGNTWQKVTKSELSARRNGDPRYVHQDHHALLIVPHPRKEEQTVVFERNISVRGILSVSIKPGIVIYDGNDGGVSVSEDGGDTWHDRGSTLETTMFYDVDVAPGDSKGHIVAGGTQDNGTLMTHRARLPGSKVKTSQAEFARKLGGDGGWVVFDPKDAAHFYASSERMHIYRRRVGSRLREVTPTGLTGYERAGVWMAFIDIDPTDPRTVFTASDRVWRTLDDGKSWRPSRSLDRSPISALEVTTRNHRRIYAGTENGGFFRSLDGGDTWSQNMSGAVLPGRIITRIEAHPNDEDKVYVTVGSVRSAGQYLKPPRGTIMGKSAPSYEPALAQLGASSGWIVDQVNPFSHVFRSLDGGETWEDADPDDTLPNVPHLALAFETNKPYRLFVAGDVWIYMFEEKDETEETEEGAKEERGGKRGEWQSYTGDLPSVTITDLVYHQATRTLTAATYGRGLWSRHVPRPPRK